MKLSPAVPSAALLVVGTLLGLSLPGTSSTAAPKSVDIVNLDGEFTPDRKKLHTIYEVPEDRALIVTDASIVNGNYTTWHGPHLVEFHRGRTTVKRASEHGFFLHGSSHAPLMFRSSTGLVFAPGSEVRLQFVNHSGCWHYNLVGYLTKL